MEDSLTESRPRVSQGPPAHGPSTINMVSVNRQESAEVRTKHLPGASVRFHQGHAARLLFCVTSVAHRAARGPIDAYGSLTLQLLPRDSVRSCTCNQEGSGQLTHLRAHETPEHLVCRLLLE